MDMSETTTAYGHVVIDSTGVPVLAHTNMKVVELVSEYLAYGWSPEELLFNHPYLSLGQIHSALAYYWDNKAILEKEIEDRLKRVDGLRNDHPEPSLMERLRARKRA
jgi:uncharacterized protein (DUF433 family)